MLLGTFGRWPRPPLRRRRSPNPAQVTLLYCPEGGPLRRISRTSGTGPEPALAGGQSQAQRLPNHPASGTCGDESTVPGHVGRARPRRRRPRLHPARPRDGYVLSVHYGLHEAVLTAKRGGARRFARLDTALALLRTLRAAAR